MPTRSAAVCLAIAAHAAHSEPFTFIGLPDTQRYSELYPAIFVSQVDWIIANRNTLNIRFVSHYGDIVQHGDRPEEWARAHTAMLPLIEGDLPWGAVCGNHDALPTGSASELFNSTLYLQYFGPHVHAGKPFFGGASPSGLSTFQFFSGGGVDFLVLHLSVDNPSTELAWAQTVLIEHRDRPAIITTHRYLQDAEDYTSGVPIVPSGRYPDVWYTFEGLYDDTGMRSEDFFRRFVRTNPNVFLVNCGHFHEEFRQISTNAFGTPVHEVLADYQDDPNGGNGYLRVMQFDTDAGTIGVESYSSWLDLSFDKDESRFTLAVDFDAYQRGDVYTFQNGIANYAGARDTWINQDQANTSYGGDANLEIDDDVRNNIFNDRQAQALVRFDGIFTTTGQPNRVPLDRAIVSATLRLAVTNDIDSPFASPSFRVYFMTRDWDENATWNSLAGGLTQGGDYAELIGSFPGDNSPTGNFARAIDVTPAVRRWAAGEPNLGFAIITEVIGGNDDGITVSSSNHPLIVDRPRLDIVIERPEMIDPCNAADLAEPFAVHDINDILVFAAAFNAQAPEADLSPGGVFDINDVLIFAQAFNAGCP